MYHVSDPDLFLRVSLLQLPLLVVADDCRHRRFYAAAATAIDATPASVTAAAVIDATAAAADTDAAARIAAAVIEAKAATVTGGTAAATASLALLSVSDSAVCGPRATGTSAAAKGAGRGEVIMINRKTH